MALQQLQTNEGVVGEEEDIASFLKKHKLFKKLGQKLIEEDEVSLSDLKELAALYSLQDLQNYARQSLQLDLLTATRFAKAVASLSADPSSPPNVSSPKPVRVLISNEEHEALNNIATRREQIKSKRNEALKRVSELNQSGQRNIDKINQIRKDIVYQINQRMDKLITESERAIADKKEVYDKYIKSLQSTEKSLNEADSQCNQWLDDVSIDMNKRKTKILTLSQQALNTHIDEVHATPNVVVEFDRDGVAEFVNQMGAICDPDDVLPIPSLRMTKIQETTATVCVENMKPSLQCDIELCRNYDREQKEEEDDAKSAEWTQLCSLQRVSEYEMDSLAAATRYALRARFKTFSANAKFGEWCIPIAFKTRDRAIGKDRFSVNNSSSFQYVYKQHGNAYHIFGSHKIERNEIEKYQWLVGTDSAFKGRYGIVDDTHNASQNIKNGSVMYNNKDCVTIGTENGVWAGGVYGNCNNHQDLREFVSSSGDVVSIEISYSDNVIVFTSKRTGKTATKQIRNGMNSTRFVAEFGTPNSTMKLL